MDIRSYLAVCQQVKLDQLYSLSGSHTLLANVCMYTLYMLNFENCISVIHICFQGRVSFAQPQIRYT